MFVSDIALWPLLAFLICFHIANFRKGPVDPEVYNLKLFKYQRIFLQTALKSREQSLLILLDSLSSFQAIFSMEFIILNMLFYTHVEYSPPKTIYIKYYMEKQINMAIPFNKES